MFPLVQLLFAAVHRSLLTKLDVSPAFVGRDPSLQLHTNQPSFTGSDSVIAILSRCLIHRLHVRQLLLLASITPFSLIHQPQCSLTLADPSCLHLLLSINIYSFSPHIQKMTDF